MVRLKFEMYPYIPHGKPQNGVISRFMDGKGRETESWWNCPPESIDHVGPEYLRQRHRHPNSAVRHDDFIKRRFKEEMKRLKEEGYV